MSRRLLRVTINQKNKVQRELRKPTEVDALITEYDKCLVVLFLYHGSTLLACVRVRRRSQHNHTRSLQDEPQWLLMSLSLATMAHGLLAFQPSAYPSLGSPLAS
jgi:hypothetical protein